MKVKVVTDGTKRNERFEDYCLESQGSLKKMLGKRLKKLGREIVKGNGFLYSKGNFPVLLVAHLDTVHEKKAKEIVYSVDRIYSPQGIGGDDRCGIYMIMEIIKEIPCHVLFCEDEEMGGIGAREFVKTELCKSLVGDLLYAVELDRMNANDAVFYNCDNPEFEKFITETFWKKAYGSYTDIVTVCPALQIAGVNLSCGYYNQHTKKEYVDLTQMETAIAEVKALLHRTTENDLFEFIEEEEDNVYLWGYGGYTIAYRDRENKLKHFSCEAFSFEEAIGKFAIKNSDICVDNAVHYYFVSYE